VGLISDEAWADFLAKQERQQRMKKLLEATKLTGEMADFVKQAWSCVVRRASCAESDEAEINTARVGERCSAEVDLSAATGQPLAQLLKRPEITIEHLVPVLRELAAGFFAHDPQLATPDAVLPSSIRSELKSVETEIKYEGYLQQQQRAIERLKKAEQRNIPEWFDYRSVSGLSREMQEKLTKVRPRTLGHASRIPGVTPAAVSLVNVYIEIQAKRRQQAVAI
jgi:tRNA uridine 5-carboxymethylaminomethyl modification enzyme